MNNIENIRNVKTMADFFASVVDKGIFGIDSSAINLEVHNNVIEVTDDNSFKMCYIRIANKKRIEVFNKNNKKIYAFNDALQNEDSYKFVKHVTLRMLEMTNFLDEVMSYDKD